MKKKTMFLMVVATVFSLHANLLAEVLIIQDGDIYQSVTVPSTLKVEMIGGWVGTFEMEGGIVNVRGGIISGSSIQVYSGSTFNMFGGRNDGVGEIGSYGGTINIYGGEPGVVMTGGGTVNIHGGDWEDFIYAYAGTINIYGYNLNFDQSGGRYGDGLLTGFWRDGTPFSLNYADSEPDNFTWQHVILHEIPEDYVLTMQTEPNDVNTITPSIGDHNLGGIVEINAEQFIDCPSVYQFHHWEGDVNDPNSANTTVFMDSDKIITAVFVDNRECGDECHPDNLFGDYNHDCIIDFNDFAHFTNNWLVCTKPECD